MDRNQVIGFALLALLLIGYLSYTQYSEKNYFEKKRADSIAFAIAHPRPKVDSSFTRQVNAVAPVDSNARKNMPPAYFGQVQNVTLENNKLSVSFSSKGASPVAAVIKAEPKSDKVYKTYRQKPLTLFSGNGNVFSMALPVDNGKSTADLYFVPVTRTESNGDKTVDFTADLGGGRKMDIVYTLPADDYMMRCSISLTGMPTTALPLTWQVQGLKTEKDIATERMYSQVYYQNKNGDNDYFTVRGEEKTIHDDGTGLWFGFRKQYFSTALICDDGFGKIDDKYSSKIDDTTVVAQNTATMQLPLKAAGAASVASLKWYIGPNDYRTLAAYKEGLEEMVPLGWGPFSFVKYINRWALMPIFYFLAIFISSYPVIIMILTFFIRLLTSFFTYKSYLSSAKMRVMKPELDELRAKCGDDQQKYSMEQMKLYRAVGINPLGGCLPMLFQMPIMVSIYYMLPAFVEFRQQHFLWANDLSSYDSILNLPFTIPWYGDHVSLFTLIMTATSLFLAVYNRNMTPQQNDPNAQAMKYMPYFMPIIFLGMFNKMPAALTFYYAFANILSIAQQFVIQKYFINEKAIHAQLQQNKNKPATPSKWAAKMEEMQKLQTERAKVPARSVKNDPRKK